ncbi:MAG: sigma-54-dependent Fis family transcriptional regulator [Alphaproteobacteria bacterium]|nr:MAG: sigma-54-dependent Fis family transcriptional regulator [Alphaproteobacteria bacterium]
MTGGQMETIRVELFGTDVRVEKALQQARNLSVSKAAVLVVGENGVGKRTLGRYIHENSGRAEQPFELVDCSLPAQDVENRILGHRDNATGRFNKGILEVANKGTVVFANIDCLDEEFQKRLHKIINELEDYDIDVRLVATTTKNLSKLVGAGRFYRGLYTIFANNAVTIPALRERQEDLQRLARHFMNEATDASEISNEIDSIAMDRITSHYWANNIHELKQVISSSVNNNSSLLDESAYEVSDKKSVKFMNDDDSEGFRLMSLKDAEKLLIKKALIHTSENRTQAAKILGVSIRTLRNKINEYRNDGASYFVNLR